MKAAMLCRSSRPWKNFLLTRVFSSQNWHLMLLCNIFFFPLSFQSFKWKVYFSVWRLPCAAGCPGCPKISFLPMSLAAWTEAWGWCVTSFFNAISFVESLSHLTAASRRVPSSATSVCDALVFAFCDIYEFCQGSWVVQIITAVIETGMFCSWLMKE